MRKERKTKLWEENLISFMLMFPIEYISHQVWSENYNKALNNYLMDDPEIKFI